jgi:hypothetical protein
MSTSDLLSSTLNWPGKGLYGLKSSGKKIYLNVLISNFNINNQKK